MIFILLLILLTIFSILLYKYINSNYFFKLVTLIISFVLLYLITIGNFSHGALFYLETWKIFIMFLILGLFLIVITLIEDDDFDVYLLYFLVLIGSLIIIYCEHLLILYLGLELQTFSLFILISKNKTSIRSSEAGLKYFILGAISSGLYLLGLCLLFIFGLSLNVKYLFLNLDSSLVLLSTTLILLSFGFKLGLTPLHFWMPDIYEGSSWDVLSLISTLPKISVLSLFIQLMVNSNLLLLFSLSSIVIGTIGALNQTKLKRLLAYSSISQIGFIIIGFNMISSLGYEISFLYLLIYMLTIISLFVTVFTSPILSNYYIIELSGIQYINRILALTWLIIFLSIAGIPPLSGFISKWFILWNIISVDYIYSSIILIIFSVIGAFYYLRVVKVVYFQKQASYLTWEKILNHKNNCNYYNSLILGFGVFFSLFFIFNLDPLLNFFNYLFFYFY